MESILSYCTYSDTIRQLPENYLIAHRNTIDKTWICEPDLAANKELAIRVFLELFEFESKYCKDGLELLSKVTPNTSFYKIVVLLIVAEMVNKVGNYILKLIKLLKMKTIKSWKDLSGYKCKTNKLAF